MSHKVLWNALLVAPAVLSAALLSSTSAIAAEAISPSETVDTPAVSELSTTEFDVTSVDAIAPAELAQVPVVTPEAPVAAPVAPAQESAPSVASLEQVMQYSSEGADMGQVTSISQLSDVQPTDWAFQALQSLVERYGCIAGYPDGTYRGRNFMTRYEFAAGLNACMDRVSELIAAGLADAVTREDLATLQRLQEEFAAELATLRGRVDALESRVAEVEANQFSTTTKLNGEVIFALSAVLDEDEAFDDQVVFSDRVRLNFDTSFSGEDRLRVRFQARNIENFAGDSVGFSFSGGEGNNFVLDDLIYTFPVGERIEVTIGANSIVGDDFVASTISPLDSPGQGSVSDFGYPGAYKLAVPGGAGAGAIIQITDNLSFDFGYSAADASDPAAGEGLFNGDYSAIAQLTWLSDFVDAALTYVNAYDGGAGSSESIFGTSDAAIANTYGTQVNFKLSDMFEIGGGVTYVDVSGIGASEDYDVWTWQATLAVNDLGGSGNQLGLLAGVPPYTRDLGNPDTGFLTELYYRYRLNSNISLTPSIIWLADPYNDNETDDTFIGTLRTTFTF